MITDKLAASGADTPLFPFISSLERADEKEAQKQPVSREKMQFHDQGLRKLTLCFQGLSFKDLPISDMLCNVKGDLSRLSAKMQQIFVLQGPNIDVLDLSKIALTQDIAKNIVRVFPKLKTFFGSKLNDEALKEVCRLKELKRLFLDDCQNVTNPGLEPLKGCTQLEAIALDGASKVSSGITHLASIITLQVLIIAGSKPKRKEKRITDVHINQLQSLVNLRVLYIGKSALKKADETIPALTAALRKLQQVGIEDDSIPKVRSVLCAKDFEITPLDAVILAMFQLHPNLCDFNGICVPKYDDDSFRKFVARLDSDMPSLKVTGMHNVTDIGIQALAQKKFTNLQKIELDSCYKISPEMWQTLPTAIPTLRLITIYGARNSYPSSSCVGNASIEICNMPVGDFRAFYLPHHALIQSHEKEKLFPGFHSYQFCEAENPPPGFYSYTREIDEEIRVQSLLPSLFLNPSDKDKQKVERKESKDKEQKEESKLIASCSLHLKPAVAELD
jgi:hypothetical protein